MQQQNQPQTLLSGKPYTPAAKTDIRETFKRLGWTPPSKAKQTEGEAK